MPKDTDAAATRIQARYRGNKIRTQRQKAIAGITRLQAQQRGRYSRRAYAQLLAFAKEQEAFLHDAKRRQLRIWRHEQELYFLQHTTADQLETLRAFQRKRNASVIQRAWRATNPSGTAATCRAKSKSLADQILAFDPFHVDGFNGKDNVTKARDSADERLRMSATAALMNTLMGPLPSSPSSTSTRLADPTAFASRRKNVQDRIKQIVHAQKQQHAPLAAATVSPGVTLASLSEKHTRRRQLYERLVQMRLDVSRRVHGFEQTSRATRTARELQTVQVVASCANRLAKLQHPHDDENDPLKRPTMSLDTAIALISPERLEAQKLAFQAATRDWDAQRKMEAWRHHCNVVHVMTSKTKWWQTTIACSERDIRNVTARSPWDHERKVWTWPQNTQDHHDHSPPHSEVEDASDPLVIFTSRHWQQHDGNESIALVDDATASEWWRAHCMQRHLPVGDNTFNSNNDEEEDYRARFSPEALANPVFYRVRQQSQQRNRVHEQARMIDAMSARLENQVNQRVGEIEMQIEVNTRLQMEIEARRQHIKQRQTKEESAVVTIQRTYRGLQGRVRAKEIRAEYFVMVRGRAIRKGKCEECGEAQAVLECKECEESLHFCPLCWVQVHSTRRRKLHVAIPMAVVPQAAKPAPAHKPDVLPSTSVTGSSRVRSAHGRQSVDSMQGGTAFGSNATDATVAAVTRLGQKPVAKTWLPSKRNLTQGVDTASSAEAESSTLKDTTAASTLVVDALSPLEQPNDNVTRESKDDALPLAAVGQAATKSSVGIQESGVGKKLPVKAPPPAHLGVKQRSLSASGAAKKRDEAESENAGGTATVDEAQASRDDAGAISGEPLMAHNDTKVVRAPTAPCLSLKQRLGGKSSQKSDEIELTKAAVIAGALDAAPASVSDAPREAAVVCSDAKSTNSSAAPRLSLKQRMGSKSSVHTSVAENSVNRVPTVDSTGPGILVDTQSSEPLMQVEEIGADESKSPPVSSAEAASPSVLSQAHKEERKVKSGPLDVTIVNAAENLESRAPPEDLAAVAGHDDIGDEGETPAIA